jgi:hypothetical protein
VDQGLIRRAAASQRLDPGDIAAYRRDGLLVAPQPLADDRVEVMRDALSKLLHDNPDLPPESLVCPHIPWGPNHDEAAASRWFDFATDRGILDMVEQLIGPDIILWGSQVFCKPAGASKAIPWHQDGQYWPIQPLATCSVWIALDDATPENGCMRYIPGSHAARVLYPHRRSERCDVVLDLEVEPSRFDVSTARDNRLQAGQYSLHDIYLIHGSNANRSGHRRAGFVIRYMPSTSTFERRSGEVRRQAGVSFSMSQRPVWLLRGRDRGGNDFTIGHGEDYRLGASVG